MAPAMSRPFSLRPVWPCLHPAVLLLQDTGNQVIRQILLPPIIDSFSPTQGNPGDSITINLLPAGSSAQHCCVDGFDGERARDGSIRSVWRRDWKRSDSL